MVCRQGKLWGDKWTPSLHLPPYLLVGKSTM
jgi:hypothetical protein